jgi:Fur family ferric uptake transcriptional regulator
MSRTTTQRTAIRAAIEAAGRPLSPQEVLDAASTDAPGLGIATVYRALSSGVAEGWLQAVELPTGPTRYEPAHLKHHHHFRCQTCDRVFDLKGCPGNLRKMLPPGFVLDDHDIVLHGKCAECA